jgi:hypothetical protein
VEVAWQKSTYSGGSGSDCVEVGWRSRQEDLPAPEADRAPALSVEVLVRDSKNPTGPTLTIPAIAWTQLHAFAGVPSQGPLILR